MDARSRTHTCAYILYLVVILKSKRRHLGLTRTDSQKTTTMHVRTLVCLLGQVGLGRAFPVRQPHVIPRLANIATRGSAVDDDFVELTWAEPEVGTHTHTPTPTLTQTPTPTSTPARARIHTGSWWSSSWPRPSSTTTPTPYPQPHPHSPTHNAQVVVAGGSRVGVAMLVETRSRSRGGMPAWPFKGAMADEAEKRASEANLPMIFILPMSSGDCRSFSLQVEYVLCWLR